MGTGIAENRKQRSGCRNISKEMETYANPLPMNCCKLPLQNNQPKLTCPKCKSQQLIIRDKIVKCPDEACNWVQFRTVCGVQISIADIKALSIKENLSYQRNEKQSRKEIRCLYRVERKCETSFEFEKNKSNKRNGK
jgi:DNA topoisomerase-3